MRLSIYTFVKDGLFYDFHVVDMLRHHLPLADEIIVNEGYSSDGTYERIAHLDPRVKVFRSHWGKPTSFDWFLGSKNEARRRCTGAARTGTQRGCCNGQIVLTSLRRRRPASNSMPKSR